MVICYALLGSRAASWPWPAIACAVSCCAAWSLPTSGRARRLPPRLKGCWRCSRHRAQCRGGDEEPIDLGKCRGLRRRFLRLRLAVGWLVPGLKVGDSCRLVSPVSIATPLGVMPRSAAARVAAIFSLGMYHDDAKFRLRAPRRCRACSIRGPRSPAWKCSATMPQLSRVAGASASSSPQVIGTQAWVFDWLQANVGFFSAIQVETNVMFLALTMIVLVAVFGSSLQPRHAGPQRQDR